MTSPRERFASGPPAALPPTSGTLGRADATDRWTDGRATTPRSRDRARSLAWCPLAARDWAGPADVAVDAVAAVGMAEVVGVAVATLVVAGVALVAVRRLSVSFARPSVPVVDDQPASVLSDRDRLLLLVERHGGRMRQQEIVAQVEWSKAKVSRLLSELEEEGVLRKLRLGRENLIYLERGDAADRN